MQKPSIGRIVHYVAYGTPGGEFVPGHRAAVIGCLKNPVAKKGALGTGLSASDHH